MRPSRPGLGLVVALLVPPMLGAALYFYAGSHKIVPGLGGCRFVRHTAAHLDCYTREQTALVRREGLARALTEVDRSAKKDAALASACHLGWHPLGQRDGRAAAHAHDQIAKLPGGSHCRDGYAHGFLIGYFEALAGDDTVGAAVGDACKHVQRQTPLATCVHSFGHMAARAHRRSLASAAQVCEAIGASDLAERFQRARFECGYGMFMEYSLADLRRGSSSDLESFCDDAPASVLDACFAFLPARILGITRDADRAARACDSTAPVDALRDACITTFARSVGDDAACRALATSDERRACRAQAESVRKP